MVGSGALGAAPGTRPRDQGGHFDVYRAETVSVTSTLFAGGDWHWRLTSGAGLVLVDCGGYRNRADALVAVDALRSDAWSATAPARP